MCWQGFQIFKMVMINIIRGYFAESYVNFVIAMINAAQMPFYPNKGGLV